MWIIKNRVTGEYDRKGLGNGFSHITRYAWSNIGHAKNHVAQKVRPFRIRIDYLKWYLQADFIEIDENGTHEVIPVGKYLTYLLNDEYTKLPNECVTQLEEYLNA